MVDNVQGIIQGGVRACEGYLRVVFYIYIYVCMYVVLAPPFTPSSLAPHGLLPLAHLKEHQSPVGSCKRKSWRQRDCACKTALCALPICHPSECVAQVIPGLMGRSVSHSLCAWVSHGVSHGVCMMQPVAAAAAAAADGVLWQAMHYLMHTGQFNSIQTAMPLPPK